MRDMNPASAGTNVKREARAYATAHLSTFFCSLERLKLRQRLTRSRVSASEGAFGAAESGRGSSESVLAAGSAAESVAEDGGRGSWTAGVAVSLARMWPSRCMT